MGAFPIGIDPSKFEEGLTKPSVKERIAALQEKFQGVMLMVGVDRLDYIKGMPHKIYAFQAFLSEHPEWVGKIVLLQVVVPSREDVEEYKNLRAHINELVGSINGKFGTPEFVPIHLLHKSVAFEELLALYAVSDVCIVSSTRDGMNLVAFEYVASQKEKHGVLILSEFAGAAQNLDGSLICNPWSVEQVSAAMYEAVRMSDEQRAVNHKKLEKYIKEFTSARWGKTFVSELKKVPGSTKSNLKLITGRLLKFIKDGWDAADGFDGSQESRLEDTLEEDLNPCNSSSTDATSPEAVGLITDVASSMESSNLEEK